MKMNYYPTIALKTSLLTLIWCSLANCWENPPQVAMGAGAALVVAWLNTEQTGNHVFPRIMRMLRYCLWLGLSIFRSGCHLSLLILNPKLPINPKMIEHRCELEDESSTVLLGNSITLTPGTITVELNAGDLVVHTIDDSSAGDVTSRHMEQQIDGLFPAKGTT
ncbi:MAG: Na+/H+ antiporter subunit E [Planctomycetota bacterium]|nr:Na+/H+ antiporter subunit E [Planctomycetota bacterium]